MKKEVGWCNYFDKEWVDKYNNLTYCNYNTKIVGNTFYILCDIRKDFVCKNFIDKYVLKLTKNYLQNICIIPLIKTNEETIRDVLRSWNFNVKYKWLDNELEYK